MKSRKTGTNTSTIIDVRKKRREYLRGANATCSKCRWLQFGYYCSKKKRTATIGDGTWKCYCNMYKEKDNKL